MTNACSLSTRERPERGAAPAAMSLACRTERSCFARIRLHPVVSFLAHVCLLLVSASDLPLSVLRVLPVTAAPNLPLPHRHRHMLGCHAMVRPVLVLLACVCFRLLNALCTGQTVFNPDEYWQSLEVAYALVWRSEGSTHTRKD